MERAKRAADGKLQRTGMPAAPEKPQKTGMIPEGPPPGAGMPVGQGGFFGSLSRRRGPGGSSFSLMIVLMVIAMLSVSIPMPLVNWYSFQESPVLIGILYILFYTLPLMFIVAVYSFPLGAMCFLFVEITGMVFYFDRLYILSYQLLALFTTNLFIQRNVYKSLWRTVLTGIVSAVGQGGLLFIIWELAQNLRLEEWNIALLPRAIFVALPERLSAFLFLYLFFRFLPRKLLSLFPPGRFHHEFREKPQGAGFTEGGPSALGMKIGRYMIAEGMLIGFGITLFASSLLPGIGPDAGMQILFLLKVNLCVFVESVPIVVAVNFLLHGRIIRPLRSMTRGMQAFVSHGGDARGQAEAFIDSLDIATGDELESLYHSMSEMVGEVNRYIHRMEVEKKLEEDLRVAQAASEAKSNFLSHMSHEIRTPINAVIGLDEMILRESHENGTLRYARDIRNAGRTLLGIVNDILDFSRIESGKLEIIPEVYELSSMLNDMMTMMLPKADEKGLDFRISVAADMPSRLFGDDLRIRQCCVNLLSNAIKYTQQGKVRMKLAYEDAGDEELFLKVCVTDTGIGIREEDIPRLTKPFERIEEERNRSVEGTGLGMSITSNLLELMGSSLKVESEYGRGSTFSFMLKQKIVDRKPIGNFMEDYQKAAEQEEAYRERFHAPEVRILVVDDTPTNLTVIRGLLRKTEIKVDTVMSGREMLEKVVKEYYDLIFLDQRMPVMDGIEALHLMELLAERKNPKAPCIALTANAVSGAREMFLSEGFTDYLTKPVSPAKLEEMLLKYLPEEKVILPDSPGFSVKKKDTEELSEEREEGTGDRLRNIPGIDYEAAISRCMEDGILIEALKDFGLSAQHVPDEIEKFLESGDIENYTIRVHGLKSSAAVVGATVLSELAAELERCGKEGDTEKIGKETPKLVGMYRDYAKQLAFLTEEENDTEDAEPISPKKLNEAYSAIRDFLEAFDYESAEEVLNMLKSFAIPKSEQTRYNELKEKILLLDRDGALELIGKP